MATLNLEIPIGPALRTALDVLECARDLVELVPDWHEQERRELESRILGLVEHCEAQLRIPRR